MAASTAAASAPSAATTMVSVVLWLAVLFLCIKKKHNHCSLAYFIVALLALVLHFVCAVDENSWLIFTLLFLFCCCLACYDCSGCLCVYCLS